MQAGTAMLAACTTLAALALNACSSSHTNRSGNGASKSSATAAQPEAGSGTAPPSINPCTLLSRSKVQSALGQPVATAKEAPLGPTCIYSSGAGAQLATVAVPQGSAQQVQARMSNAQTTTTGGHQVTCGLYGQPTLVAPLTPTSFLEISAPCPAAVKLAGDALARLK